MGHSQNVGALLLGVSTRRIRVFCPLYQGGTRPYAGYLNICSHFVLSVLTGLSANCADVPMWPEAIQMETATAAELAQGSAKRVAGLPN